ncbi:MAG: energy-coupling factor transporter transmembrane protein EcfT [Atopobiaceae bacterium]|jgi:energy-coupling factor transporter transmembrane protein EcfT|nr:energy-coupling factor transporter transmembrane protein EcfT [Atopobiaceae bacterium]MCI2173955.1 energy-coupling factor transporter transmembrane protein EcfT [Atopobiaceae bacterium]MCI2207955.1 energy-coupling factor transporter transmembrane protein EcfT [Atopobiaceae bacterium]
MRGMLPLGGYVVASTRVHECDARVKLVLLLAVTVVMFVSVSPLVIAVSVISLAALARAARVPASQLLRSVRPTVVVLAFALLANAFVVDGTADVVIMGGFGLSAAGLVRGATAVARIVLLVGFALVVSSTTTGPQLADAVVSLMSPLAAFGFPVGDFAMVLSIALRFVPLAVGEFDRIMAAQRARGADLDTSSSRRLGRWAAVLVPLVVSLFRDADVLADAMRDRCYRGEGRTRLARRLSAADVATLVCGLASAAFVCIVSALIA